MSQSCRHSNLCLKRINSKLGSNDVTRVIKIFEAACATKQNKTIKHFDTQEQNLSFLVAMVEFAYCLSAML